jgi:phage virion morphogenesis protein
MIDVQIAFRGEKTLLLTLNALKTMDFTAFHKQAADHMKGSVEQNYARQQAPDGTPWRQHGEQYLLWLAQKGASPGRVLDFTGAMRKSLDTQADSGGGRVFHRSESYGDEFHGDGVTTDLLAVFHTFGTSKRSSLFRYPARPQMGFSESRDDVGQLTAMLSRFVSDAAKQVKVA